MLMMQFLVKLNLLKTINLPLYKLWFHWRIYGIFYELNGVFLKWFLGRNFLDVFNVNISIMLKSMMPRRTSLESTILRRLYREITTCNTLFIWRVLNNWRFLINNIIYLWSDWIFGLGYIDVYDGRREYLRVNFRGENRLRDFKFRFGRCRLDFRVK